MGAALGAGLGALLGVAGGYERAQAEKRQNANAAFLDLAMKNPSVFASDPALLKEVGKRTSPEFADLLGGIGKHAAQFQSQIQGAVSGGSAPAPAAGGPPPSPSGQMVAGPGAPAGGQPANAQDPMAAHIQQLDTQINKLEAIMTSPGASDPSNAAAVEHLKTLLTDLRQQRTQLTSEKYSTDKQATSEAFSEKMTDKREAAAEARQDKAIGAMSERMSQTMAHSEYLEGLRENFRERLETIKDAKTTAQQRRAFTTTLAGLSKTRSQIEARANKAPDQTTRQAEVDTFNSGLDMLKLGMDDPDKIKQLESLRLSVGEAKPGVIFGETPGTVTPETPKAAASGTIRTDTSGKKWKLSADGSKWEPADAGPAAAPAGR